LEYDGVEILRTDDSTGKTHISIKNRTAKANNWGANLYIDMHHNAGVNGGSGGGVVAFCKKKDENGKKYRDAIYEAVIAAGGLRGNRSQPLQEKNYDTMTHAKMTAVLMEYGFMDSKTDAPVILTEAYSKLVAYATMEGIAKVAGLKKRADADNKETGVCNVELKVLKKGAKGDAVRAMQTLLIGYGFSCGKSGADGSFGSATEKALKAYQNARDLSVDGSCGAKTWAKLLGAVKEGNA
jgi:N-acetylmuramoyl-L-alanine amidase